ncbi:ELMO domain-containing protein A [Morus notabilis]|uniref:ELMO domain-containing protein A n=1 Tax=Morus notabilis TaxID=981085 RepID=W9RSL9_9ROSA|nr:ELMO domain-containing protein A [Morus notabilis]
MNETINSAVSNQYETVTQLPLPSLAFSRYDNLLQILTTFCKFMSPIEFRKEASDFDSSLTCDLVALDEHSSEILVVVKSSSSYDRSEPDEISVVCRSLRTVLTGAEEERLKRLKHRMKVYFDASRPDHQEALRALWSATYPNQELHGLISDQWKEMGWQGRDPSTDFRGAGFISLENLLFFAKTFSTSFQRLLKKQGGKRAAWEYPFAVAGVNITFMIMQMLDLDALKPRTFVRAVFLQILSENEWAFDLLYCVAFVVMDKQWLERNATYMEFNDVLKSTRAQLERELLMDDVLRIEDMPSYSLLS